MFYFVLTEKDEQGKVIYMLYKTNFSAKYWSAKNKEQFPNEKALAWA